MNKHAGYMDLLERALRGARSTLRETDPDATKRITVLIENLESLSLREIYLEIIELRNETYRGSREASDLLDAVHNLPNGLAGIHDGKWDWKTPLWDGLEDHEEKYLGGLRKYSGLRARIDGSSDA